MTPEGHRQQSSHDGLARRSSPEALFRCHYRALVQSLALIAGCDQDVAADVVGDAFLELERRWEQICGYGDPVSWVRRVALNRFFNYRRSLARRARALVRLESDQGMGAVDGPDPEGLAVRQALRDLPLKQRTAIVLFYFADLSVADIAEAMGVSEGSVNQHLHRAKEALRKRLEVTR